MKEEIKDEKTYLYSYLNGLISYPFTRDSRNRILELFSDLQQKVDQYENPDDMTLFYMWLDEKAKDKMKCLEKENKRLNNDWNELEEYIRSYINLLVDNPDMIEQGQLDILYEVLDKMKEILVSID